MFLTLRKCKNDRKILTVLLVPYSCPLIPEIARFSMGFPLKFWPISSFKAPIRFAFMKVFSLAHSTGDANTVSAIK